MIDGESNGIDLESGDLSAFEVTLDGLNVDSLPEDPNVRKETELDIIRRVLADLSEEFGVELQICMSGDLGTPMSLNHRLDALSYHAPRDFPVDMTNAFQVNDMDREMAEDLFQRSTDEDELQLMDEKKLEQITISAYRLIEVILYLLEEKSEEAHEIVRNQHEMFWANLDSQNLILGTLQKVADFIQDYSASKPERDAEIIASRAYLQRCLSKWQEKAQGWEENFPHFIPILGEASSSLSEIMAGVSDDSREPRWYLMQIVKNMGEVCKVTMEPGEDTTMAIDQQALGDVREMASSL